MDRVSAIVLGGALYGGKKRCPRAEFEADVQMDEFYAWFGFEDVEE